MYRDTDIFISLLEPHYSDAVNYCNGLCKGNSDEAKDLLQESLLKSLENFNSLREDSKFRSWLFTIITREFYNSKRNTFWKKFVSSDAITLPEIFSDTQNNENKDLLLKSLSILKSKERSAILLYELGGFSIEEISNIQKENSVSAVKSRLSRAREKLRTHISKLESSPHTIKIKKSNSIGDIQDETIDIIAGLKAEK